jgi:hypothetical protein
METVVIVIIVAVAAVAVFLWTRRRATPPATGAAEIQLTHVEPRRLVPPPEPQVLDRNTVLGRNRVFDPTNWDDTPDGSEEDGPDQPGDEPVGDSGGEDLPRFFDREYLERKSRGESTET